MEIKFKDILDNPQSGNLSQLEYLEKLAEDYPYFQIAHLLLAKKLHQLGRTADFNNYLKKAAIYASDRKKLYHLIHEPDKEVRADSNLSPNLHIVETSQTQTAKEILNQRLEEITQKKGVEDVNKFDNTQTGFQRNEEKIDGKTTADSKEKKNIKSGYFSIEELLELPEETKNHDTEDVKNIEPVKEIPNTSKLSFKDWLHYYSRGKIVNQETKVEDEKPNSKDLIDKFIKEEPRISPAKNNFFSPVNMARKSVVEPDDLISETLANIYYAQGNLQKSLQMYEKLSLKYPEKSTFFASQIEKIQNSLKSN